jgi:DNA-binding response OmpR family regulator
MYMSGPDVVRRLRAESPTLQIMIVSDTANVAMAKRGFGIGADGHIALPDEADALVETVYRVARLPNPEDVTVVTDLWTLVIAGGRVTVDGERAWLARVEVRLLSLLARHPGRVFSRDELQRYLHPKLDEPLPRVVDVTITRMRRILQMRTGGRNLIESVWGRGIKLGDPRAETGAE